jgi:hypothetical protein
MDALDDPVLSPSVELLDCPPGMVAFNNNCMVATEMLAAADPDGYSIGSANCPPPAFGGYKYKCKKNADCCSQRCITRKDGRQTCGAKSETVTPTISTTTTKAPVTTARTTKAPGATTTTKGGAVGKVFSKAYGAWTPTKAGECSKEIHDSYNVVGEDGKIYPTWHPPVHTDPVTGATCFFGHEHGDDPKKSSRYANEPVPFGFVNENHYSGQTDKQRHESHVGHKIQVGNGVKICYNNDQSKCTGLNHIATCDVLIKVHQGTSTADAFVNNLHEVFLYAKCDEAGTNYNYGGFGDIPLKSDRRYGHLDYKLKFMDKFNTPGVVNTIDGCPNFLSGTFDLKVDNTVLPITPANSPAGGGARKIVDNTCIDAQWLVPAGQYSTETGWQRRNTEHWVVAAGFFNRYDSQQVFAFANPYMTTFDAARYYDATSPGTMFLKYFIDLCYKTGDKQIRERPGSANAWCTKVKQMAPASNPMQFDDVRSPFKGTQRNISPNRLTVNNPGPATIFYSDSYGENLTTDPKTCGINRDGKDCLKQFIGIGKVDDCGADVFLPNTDWGEGYPSIHAPN